MRSDARRNRDQILRTVRDLLLRHGAHVPMEEIATAAGVGVGTLYRHFPDRQSLLKAVAIQNMTWAAEEATAAVAGEPDEWSGVARLVRRIFELRLGDPIPLVLPQLLDWAREDPDFQTARRGAAHAVATVLERAKEAGVVRPDLTVADLMTLATARPEPAAVFGEEAAPRLTARHLQIVLDGLRPRPGSPLPGPAVDDAEMEHHFTGTPAQR